MVQQQKRRQIRRILGHLPSNRDVVWPDSRSAGLVSAPAAHGRTGGNKKITAERLSFTHANQFISSLFFCYCYVLSTAANTLKVHASFLAVLSLVELFSGCITTSSSRQQQHQEPSASRNRKKEKMDERENEFTFM